MSFFSKVWDERFREHRRRSTSIGGVVGGVVAMGMFAWHYYVDHRFSWDLLAVGVSIVVVKWALMTWYVLTD